MSFDYMEVLSDMESRRNEAETRLRELEAAITSVRRIVFQNGEQDVDRTAVRKPRARSNGGRNVVESVIKVLEDSPNDALSIEQVHLLSCVESIKNVRSTLARLANENRIRKAGRGHYRALSGVQQELQI